MTLTRTPPLGLTDRSSDRAVSVSHEVGIDTIKVIGTAPYTDLGSLTESRGTRHLDRDTGEVIYVAERARIEMEGGLQVDLFASRDGLTRWSVEKSLPNWVSGNNLTPLNLDRTREALGAVRDVLQPTLGPIEPIDDWIIRRLDLVRDFRGVQALPSLLEGLGGVRVSRATRGAALYRGARGHHSTLVQGSPGQWQATLYDKFQESMSNPNSGPVAELGHLRCEISLRRPVLKRLHRDRVGDLDQGRLEILAREYFFHAGFDQEVKGMDRTMLEVGFHWDELTDQERRLLPSVLGSLKLQAAGMPVLRSPATQRKYERLADKIGIGPADFRAEGSRRLRLDFDSGQQVVD